jgi:hypothetical protein
MVDDGSAECVFSADDGSAARGSAEGRSAEASSVKVSCDASLDFRYTIGASQNRAFGLDFFASRLSQSGGVDACLVVRFLVRHLPVLQLMTESQDFIAILKKHLFFRLIEMLGLEPDTVGADQWVHTILRDHKIYSHKLLRINYTTYDVRRSQDVLHVGTPHCNVMFLNGRYGPETWRSEHPYVYAKVLGVFHADVSYAGPLPPGLQRPEYRRIDFAWIQWYHFADADTPFGLDRVAPCLVDSAGALTFIDPADVVRCVHLIPRFSQGKFTGRIPDSLIVDMRDSWEEYFINR